MESLFNVIWLIPVYPLLAFFAIIVLGVNRNQKASAGLAIGSMVLATLHSWALVLWAIGDHHIQIDGVRLPVHWLGTGYEVFEMGFAVDGFTAAMLFMVPFVCLLIFIYASEYMEGYEAEFGRYSRFFAYVSLFASGMLWLVIADNLLLLFMAWEIMGLCSYLLIGFWFEKSYPDEAKVATPGNPIQGLFQFWGYAGPDKIPPKLAALKAFLTTRIGDTLLFAGMLILWSYAGTLTFREIFAPEHLEQLSEVTLWGMPVATLSALLIFGGVIGKSAQFPLHVWLPDAMEGPTPVSALIHAATMVSAGVYLLARMLPLFTTIEGGPAMQWAALIGAITAVLGATIGLAQYDVKRVLAYSTISQLGYMVMALGLGGFLAGVFHMLTHAFFKALLFLGSGSIIHAMEHGAHHVHDHHTDPQDMRNMGGLRSKMQTSFYAYLIGTLALVGIPPLAGFWSKDEILAEAFIHAFGDHPDPLALGVYLAGAVAAAFTALYMGRQIGLVFLGKPRTELAEHAHEPGWRMTGPLVVLAFFAAVIGLANIPENIGGNAWLHTFAGEVHELAHETAPGLALKAVPFNLTVAAISTVVGLLFFLFGAWRWSRLPRADSPDPLELVPRVGRPIFTILYNKYYFDEIYRGVLIYPVMWLAYISGKFDYDWVINRIVNFVGTFTRVVADGTAVYDQGAIDGVLVNGIPSVFRWIGGQLRLLQTGRAQNYLLLLIIGVLILVGLYLLVWSGQDVGLASIQ
jgi:NADH-quinone oxidoreductase subunit L